MAYPKETRNLIRRINRVLAKRQQKLAHVSKSHPEHGLFCLCHLPKNGEPLKVIKYHVDALQLALELGVIKVSQGQPASPEAAALQKQVERAKSKQIARR